MVPWQEKEASKNPMRASTVWEKRIGMVRGTITRRRLK